MGHFWWISVPKIMYYSKMRSCLFSNLFIIKIFPYISAWYKLGVSLFDRYIPDFYLKMIRFKIPNLNFRPLSDRQMFTCDPMWIKSNKTWAFTRVRGRPYFDHFLYFVESARWAIYWNRNKLISSDFLLCAPLDKNLAQPTCRFTQSHTVRAGYYLIKHVGNRFGFLIDLQ